jgi:ATP-binding cassette, subfamily C, bacterial
MSAGALPPAADPVRRTLPVADRAAALAALRPLLRRRRGGVALAFLLLLAGTAADLVGPILLGEIIDRVAAGEGPGAITAPAVGLFLSAAVGNVLLALGMAKIAEVGESALAELREEVVAHALALPLERLERAGTGDLYSRVSEDVRQVAEAVKSGLPTIAASTLAIVLTLVGLGALDPRFALAGLCAMPIQVVAVRWYLRRSPQVYADERAASSTRSDRILNAFAGARTARALGLGTGRLDWIGAASQRQVAYGVEAVRLRTGLFNRLNGAEFVGLGALLVAGFFLVRSGSTSIGDATAAAFFFIRLFDPVNGLIVLLDDAQQGWACLGRLVGVTEEPLPAAADDEAPEGDLRIAGVGHSYTPGRPVLTDIDLALAAGERVALVGVSGAGKSTLARIAAGVLSPGSGAVRHPSVGLVTQEVHVFAGTLAEDLRLARPEATEAELEAALGTVEALAWARALPAGLETRIGEGGVVLTALQAQQLALARLVLADPALAVLDEATAEAGSAGARVLERAAEAALAGRTALVVAHRLTQAAAADRVVVLERGRVVEDGPHRELVRAGGAYAALWASWRGAR